MFSKAFQDCQTFLAPNIHISLVWNVGGKFRKESYFLVVERKSVQRQIGKDPTKWLESNEQDPFRIGKDMTERKMPVGDFNGI